MAATRRPRGQEALSTCLAAGANVAGSPPGLRDLGSLPGEARGEGTGAARWSCRGVWGSRCQQGSGTRMGTVGALQSFSSRACLMAASGPQQSLA